MIVVTVDIAILATAAQADSSNEPWKWIAATAIAFLAVIISGAAVWLARRASQTSTLSSLTQQWVALTAKIETDDVRNSADARASRRARFHVGGYVAELTNRRLLNKKIVDALFRIDIIMMLGSPPQKCAHKDAAGVDSRWIKPIEEYVGVDREEARRAWLRK